MKYHAFGDADEYLGEVFFDEAADGPTIVEALGDADLLPEEGEEFDVDESDTEEDDDLPPTFYVTDEHGTELTLYPDGYQPDADNDAPEEGEGWPNLRDAAERAGHVIDSTAEEIQ